MSENKGSKLKSMLEKVGNEKENENNIEIKADGNSLSSNLNIKSELPDLNSKCKNIDDPLLKPSKVVKKIRKIKSLSQRGYSGPGVEKHNQDNFFVFKNFHITLINRHVFAMIFVIQKLYKLNT